MEDLTQIIKDERVPFILLILITANERSLLISYTV